MKSAPTPPTSCAGVDTPPTAPGSRRASRARGGFTLAEVLAALAFMAIVIPVAVEGLRIANVAGVVAQRKIVAARVADTVLSELVATGLWERGSQRGAVTEGAVEYAWEAQSQAANLNTLRLLTVEVRFPVQGREHEVRLSTLVDNAQQ